MLLVTSACTFMRRINDSMWEITHTSHTKKYSALPNIAAILTLFCGGGHIDDVYKEFLQFVEVDFKTFNNAIMKLVELDLLVKPSEKKHNFAKRVFKKWHRYNWLEAANYYLATYDYPFVDDKDHLYFSRDSKRMLEYNEKEPDMNRSKEYQDSLLDHNLPDIHVSLNKLSMGFNSGLSNNNYREISLSDLEIMCAVAFSKLRVRKSISPNCADIIRKTSPSGGARHPTEGYIITTEKIGTLNPGIYHYSLNKNSLELIGTQIPDDIASILPGVYRAKFRPKVIFILSSIFERNMYRYREPRTFRSIYIDVGHMAETIKLLSTALGFKYFSHTYIDEQRAEELLKLNKFQEGVIYSMAIA